MRLKEFKYFYPEAPRLIKIDQPLMGHLMANRKNVAEIKKNGQRLLLHANVPEGSMFEFWGRKGDLLTYKPNAQILDELSKLELPGYCVLDGELRHNKVKGIYNRIMFYDVHVWDGELLLAKPFWYRRSLLEKIMSPMGDPLSCAVQYRTGFKELFRQVIKDPENEGLVIKNLQGILRLGRVSGIDSNWMWKIRRPNNSYRF